MNIRFSKMTNKDDAVKTEIADRYRELSGFYQCYFRLVTAISVMLSFFFLFKIPIFGWIMMEMQYFSILMAAFLSLTFLLFPSRKTGSRKQVPWYDALACFLSLWGPAYVGYYNMDILLNGWEIIPPTSALLLGGITWILIIEAVRRIGGPVLAVVILVVSLYPLFAFMLPGVLMAKQYSLNRIIGFHFLGTDSMYGLPTRVFCRLLIGYMIFAVTLQATGAATFFINVCLAVLGSVRGGAAKVSILASAFFATMSGSALANVVTTGSLTIPTMKRLGYPPHYASAVEACASTGGVLTPPVMGATAFIMADFIGVSYASVCAAAALPAFLYWVSLFAQTDFFAARTDLKGLPREELPSLWHTVKAGWFLIAALIVLMYVIFIQRTEALAPYYATAALLILSVLNKKTRVTPSTMIRVIEGTGKILTELMSILIGVGMIIGAMSLTGIAHGLSGTLTQLGGDHRLLLLIVGAFTSFLLGIGLTISACYIFLAMLLAPTLVNLGINEMAAHLFLVYWGSVSYITPPVALAVYAASSIGGASPMKTAFQAIKLGFVSLLVPFFFVFNPVLVVHGEVLRVLYALSTATFGIILLSAAFEGYVPLLKRITIPVRAVFVAAGLLAFHPGVETDLYGLVFLAIGIVVHVIFQF